MLPKDAVIDLYLQYGFEKENGTESEGYLVFFSQNGYFQNAEIVILDDALKTSSINKQKYEEAGYSVRIKKFSDLSEVHAALFGGFFGTVVSNNKTVNEYELFCMQQSKKLLYPYEYIPSSFIEDGFLKDGSVIDRIVNLFNKEDRQLIILEASAGYGKTCTSFEIMNSIATSSPKKIPLIAELSKNRKANVFRYVLLSEIDQKFPSLSSDLVTNEIKNGHIFLIVDGFDELLSKSYSSAQESDSMKSQDVQSMLDTIAQLIPDNSNSKILLTSRKSLIFAGDNYNNWVKQNIPNCNITKLQLSAPSVRDWLGYEKLEILKNNNIDLTNLSNPVLLTTLKNEPLEGFKEKYSNNDAITEKYLELLLDREKIRQDLPLTIDEQISIMSNLAAQMVSLDISSDDIDFIKEIISEIVKPKIKNYLDEYDLFDNIETKPSESEFINKLSQHALLDRVSSQNNAIGFINEFVFGIMIAKAIINNNIPVVEVQGKYLDIVITAYSAYSYNKKMELYNLLLPVLEKENSFRKINAMVLLTGNITGEYFNEYFNDIQFIQNTNIKAQKTFKKCNFYNCIFDRCNINTDSFCECHFYGCSFFDNNIIEGNEKNCYLSFFNCLGHEKFASVACRLEIKEENTIDYERIILEQFWKPGYKRAEPNRSYSALIKGASSENRQSFLDAIESLSKKNIIIKKSKVCELNFEKMDIIRKIIGR